MARKLTAVLGITILLAGCAGVRLQDAGVPGKSWQRVAYQEEGDDDPIEILEEGLEDLQDAGAGFWWLLAAGLGFVYIINESDDEEDENHSFASTEQLRRPPQPLTRWQRNLEDAAVARGSLWRPTPHPAAAVAEPSATTVDGRTQSRWGALAIDSRQGDQWGWAVDYSSRSAAEERALGECGRGCSVVMTFQDQCAAYAADTQAGSTVYGWARASTGASARSAALGECRGQGGTSCIVRSWGCCGA